MVRTSSSRTKTLKESVNTQALHRLRTASIIAAVVGGAAAIHMAPHLIKTPMYTSSLSGELWVKELLAGHGERFHNAMGMGKQVFHALDRELRMYSGFQDTKHVSRHEQLAMFLYMCRSGAVHREVRERFQRSPGTISRCAIVTLFPHLALTSCSEHLSGF